MRKSKVVSGLAIVSCLTLLAGCASDPAATPGDLMRQHAVDAQSEVDEKRRLSEQWENGEKLVATGEKRVSDGEKRVKSAQRDLDRGQSDIDQGRREIAEGQRMILESKEQFREKFPGLEIKPES